MRSSDLARKADPCEAVLLHVEEHHLDAVAQPASAQGFRDASEHDDARAVVHHSAAVSTATERHRVEMCADDDLREVASKRLEQYVLALLARIALTRRIGERLEREREPALPQQPLHRLQPRGVGRLLE